jgi:hypothetical protein
MNLSRREFLESSASALAAAGGIVAVNAGAANAPGAGPEGGTTTASPTWYRTAYRRAVIDMHIPDWDPKFLSEFDPDAYVQCLVRSRAQSIVCYAQSHVGLFNYPTKVGQQHRGLRGRNILGEVIERCHANHIAVVIYTSLIFDRWAADNHPEWRMRTHDGKIHGAGGRHGLLCPNSPYREYVRRWVEEICTTFDFEGIRFDMTFWPAVCYCDHCRNRFADEVGGDLPKTVNWLDEKWVAFQRSRERWLVDFAAVATQTVRKHKPGVSVEHQSSTYPLNWQFGVTADLTKQNDFLQGDFYGDSLQGSFVRKLLEGLTPNRPFGFETSFCVELRDHTTMKSEPLLEAKASAAIADSAAFIFIDAVDPIGTVNPKVHERMGRIFDRLMPCYPHLGGDRIQDIAVYYSLDSKFNLSANNRPVWQADTSDAHTESSMQAARRLIGNHLPFGVITAKGLPALSRHKVLVLSNVNMMDDQEVRSIRDWVTDGGALYASGGTSLVDKRGRLQKDFMLADVFGVSLVKADWGERAHYIAPTADGQAHFAEYSIKYPALTRGYGMEVKAQPGALVLATTTLPWPAPDPSRFASIHSDPPWQATDRPEVVFNRFGKGRVIYCSSLLENVAGLGRTFISLIRLLNDAYTLEADAPECVEVTLFHQPGRKRYLLSLVNFQKDMPNIPVEGIGLRLRLGGQGVRRVTRLPDGVKVEHTRQGDVDTFVVPRLETLALFAVETNA